MILLALIKEDVVESDAVEVEVFGGFSNFGCGIGGSGGSSGCLASSLDLMLLVNNMNNTIPTQ